jgi:urease accessory protein
MMMMNKNGTSAQLLAMLHLASPQLPVGGFSYSQGLEAAVNAQQVTNAAEAALWIESAFTQTIATWELPTLAHLHAACAADDHEHFAVLNAEFVASRETRELREETLQMGWSLRSLLAQLPPGANAASHLAKIERLSFPAAFAATAHALGLDAHTALTAYAFGWAENQVAAAIKAVPLGELGGGRIFF